MNDPPAGAERLFPEASVEELSRLGASAEVIERVLEEGDTSDLRWLAGAQSFDDLGSWLRRFGGRRLSRRSRLFWEVVLGVESSEPHPLTSELWPL